MLIACNSFHFAIAATAAAVISFAIHSLMNNNFYISNACVPFDHAHSTYKEFYIPINNLKFAFSALHNIEFEYTRVYFGIYWNITENMYNDKIQMKFDSSCWEPKYKTQTYLETHRSGH